MEKQTLERTGKTVDEAIELAILELGVGRNEVEVDVISGGRAGILGIGAEPAKVRVSIITGSTGHASAALKAVSDLLYMMHVNVTPTIRNSGSGPDDPTVIDIQGEDAGLVIGSHGDTLRSLQYITNLVLGKRDDTFGPVLVDVEQYRERRQKQIHSLATRMAERAISANQSVTLDAMSAADRRLVHVALADDFGVTTESFGNGSDRRVVITPTGERAARATHAYGGRRRRNSNGGIQHLPRYRDDRD